jgi:hypothetical protein
MAKEKPNYEAFRYSTAYAPAEIKHAATPIEEGGSRQRFYAPTGAGEVADQHLATYLTVVNEADKDKTPIVRMTAFSDDNGRLEGGYFDAFLANALQRPVLAANAPGVDYSEWRDPEHKKTHLATPDQLEDLREKGSFRKSGAAVMRALMASSKYFELNGEYFLSATSMGVALGGGAIREGVERGVKFEGIALGEPVNVVDRNLALLAFQFVTQLSNANAYLKHNPSEIPGETQRHWLNRVREGWEANGAYKSALGRAGFLGDLGPEAIEALKELEVPILLGRGTASTLSHPGGYLQVVEALHHPGGKLGLETNENDTHSYTMTVESVVKSVKSAHALAA